MGKLAKFRARAIKEFNGSANRDRFVEAELSSLPPGLKILDAGAGSQPFRSLCSHLQYYSQDIGTYSMDESEGFSSRKSPYIYGEIDYIGDIWDVKEEDHTFDAVLCTEVLEHIPYPVEAIKEFSRLLKPGGTLILTAPANSPRHFDPYFFVSGYSDHWFQRVLEDSGFQEITVRANGDYFQWMKVETYRTMRQQGILAFILLLPSLLFFGLRRATPQSISSICMGYHVTAKKPKFS